MSVDTRWSLAIAAYFTIQMVLRILIGPGLELDEAEAILFSRDLAWGYGPQPPLYFWLQWAVFQVTGAGVVGLAVLKAAVLAGGLIVLYRALRREVAADAAAVATLATGFLPQLVWESQRSLTHTVLAVTITAVALLALLRALERGGWRDYAWLGLAMGLGVLSKLNFLPWAVGIVAAVFLLVHWRQTVRPLRMAFAGVVAVAVVAPHAIWILRNPDLALQSVRKFEIAEAGGASAALAGTGSLLVAIVGFFALAALILGGFAWLGRTAGIREKSPPIVGLLALGAVLPLLPIWLGILASGATNINDRWLLPVSWLLVSAVVLGLWDRLGDQAKRGLLMTTAGTWLLALVTLPYASLVDPGYRGSDFGPAAARILEAKAPGTPLYVAHLYVAGNLLETEPELDPTFIVDPVAVPPGPAVLVVEHDGPGELMLDEPLAARVESSFELAIPRGRRATTVAVLTLSH